MDFWHFLLLFLTITFGTGFTICLLLLRRMVFQQVRMENYLITIGQTMSDFYLKIDDLFSQSLHYYDETIYQFIEGIKAVKLEIDSTLDEYDDLREYIVPIPSSEEKFQNEEKEVLGVVRPPIFPRKTT